MARSLALTFALIVGVALSGQALALEDSYGWNQDDAVAVSGRLAKAVDALFNEARIEQYEPKLAATAETYMFVQDLKQLKRRTRSLHHHLKKGQGRDDTIRLFERIELTVRQARSKRASTPVLENSEPEIEAAREELDAMRDLYYSKPMPQVAAAPPVKEADPCKEAVTLDGVRFEFDSAKITDDSSDTLNIAAEKLKKCEDVQIDVKGFTDSSGPADYNQLLSERRAASVESYLEGQGLGKDRIHSSGYGENKPVASNGSVDGRAKNRRVELTPQT
jgi:outer membrane protein OmpA-like peptidoglycan-associated protein